MHAVNHRDRGANDDGFAPLPTLGACTVAGREGRGMITSCRVVSAQNHPAQLGGICDSTYIGRVFLHRITSGLKHEQLA